MALKLKTSTTSERLKAIIKYNPETGVFKWIQNGPGRPKSLIAGCVNPKGYRQIMVDKIRYQAHRIAWLITYDVWPEADIDHINGNRDDNRLCNLRQATRGQNVCNAPVRSDNTSGTKGVSWINRCQKWAATICIKGKIKHLGYFNNLEEAAIKAKEARDQHHGPFANHNTSKTNQTL